MKSVIFFEYAATGEGWRTIVRFSNQSSISDEDAVQKLKSELHEYFHVGIELHDVSTIKEKERVMRTIEQFVPELYRYLTIPDGERRPAIDIKYEGYVNYS
jgi:hypothetical protein